jgi:hypothetical protein
MTMTAEVEIVVYSADIGWELGRTASYHQPAIAEESVTSTEQVVRWRMHVDECLSGIATVKALRVIEVVRQVTLPVMIISAEEQYLSVSVGSRNQGCMDGYDVIGWNLSRPRHGYLQLLCGS